MNSLSLILMGVVLVVGWEKQKREDLIMFFQCAPSAIWQWTSVYILWLIWSNRLYFLELQPTGLGPKRELHTHGMAAYSSGKELADIGGVPTVRTLVSQVIRTHAPNYPSGKEPVLFKQSALGIGLFGVYDWLSYSWIRTNTVRSAYTRFTLLLWSRVVKGPREINLYIDALLICLLFGNQNHWKVKCMTILWKNKNLYTIGWVTLSTSKPSLWTFIYGLMYAQNSISLWKILRVWLEAFKKSN